MSHWEKQIVQAAKDLSSSRSLNKYQKKRLEATIKMLKEPAAEDKIGYHKFWCRVLEQCGAPGMLVAVAAGRVRDIAVKHRQDDMVVALEPYKNNACLVSLAKHYGIPEIYRSYHPLTATATATATTWHSRCRCSDRNGRYGSYPSRGSSSIFEPVYRWRSPGVQAVQHARAYNTLRTEAIHPTRAQNGSRPHRVYCFKIEDV
ncbi:hypothetical protein F5Y17DRAFT_450470 [Xylariaceae sp. FL0594]|nr:hypothetical protein F5Y17DRAFT_450470 [Xylariaceae sp. FL0594]